MTEGKQSIGNILPKAVQNQVDRANEAVKALNNQGQDQGTPPAPAPDANTPATPETPAAPQDQGTPQDQNQNTQMVPKAQYDTLKGKYDAEVPRMAKDIANLRQQVTVLVGKNQELEKSLEAALAKADTPDTDKNQPGTTVIDPEDFASYGDEFVNMAKMLNAVVEENKKLKAKGTNTGPETKSTNGPDTGNAALLYQVRAKVADFDALNSDPQFLGWLDTTVDPTYGMTMFQVLKSAESRQDAKTCIKVFNQFKKDVLGIPQPDEAPNDTSQTPPAGQEPPQAPPPGIPPNPNPGEQPQGKIWTRADIRKFYTDVTRGAFRDREQEKVALEHDIAKAQTEGRIRG